MTTIHSYTSIKECYKDIREQDQPFYQLFLHQLVSKNISELPDLKDKISGLVACSNSVMYL